MRRGDEEREWRCHDVFRLWRGSRSLPSKQSAPPPTDSAYPARRPSSADLDIVCITLYVCM